MSEVTNILKLAIRAATKPRPIQKLWQWIDAHVRIPLIVGSPNPGPLNTNLVSPMRGLYEMVHQKHIHFFTLAKSARVGGTLFAICCILHKIATAPGPIMWVDPTRKTGARFSKIELDPFIRECGPCWEKAVKNKQDWTTLEKTFKDCTLGIVGTGSAAELGGRQAEMLVLNERDKFKQDKSAEAPPAELAIIRTKQFTESRKVLENSTPTEEKADTWQNFLLGSQHYCYLPCPHCSGKTPEGWAPPEQYAPERSPLSYDPSLRGWQRLTFFKETEPRRVPFKVDGTPITEGEWKLEQTGQYKFSQFKIQGGDQYDLEGVRLGTVYECAHCGGEIRKADLRWALYRYWWRAHNPHAAPDRISAHFWAAYSPFESMGELAKKFLMAKGSENKMHDFYNSDLGLPFVRRATNIQQSHIDEIVKASPEYFMKQIPRKPIMLTMTVDVQQLGFWWCIRAWGIMEEDPNMPTWCALVDCGELLSWDQVREIAGIKPLTNGERNGYAAKGEDEKHQVFVGLIDSGYKAKKQTGVYAFCEEHQDVFQPSKGEGGEKMLGKWFAETPLESGITLLRYNDERFKQQLYYNNIKENKVLWWLPKNVPSFYKAQLTAEGTREVKDKNGRINLEWFVEGEQGNHLGDCEKMQEILRDLCIEERMEAERERILAEREKK
jgi:hypothetical protein